jgi:hypothetical protein
MAYKKPYTKKTQIEIIQIDTKTKDTDTDKTQRQREKRHKTNLQELKNNKDDRRIHRKVCICDKKQKITQVTHPQRL